MDRDKHDPNHDSEAYLFAQMDDILADAQVREAEMAISRHEQLSRQAFFLNEIRPLLGKDVCDDLDVLYGEGNDIDTTADEVESQLMAEDPTLLSVEDRWRVEYLYNLSDLIMQVTEGLTDDGTFIPSYVKNEVQLTVLDSEGMFTYKQKHKIIAIIDDVMPGESLDVYDPAIVAHALAKRHALFDTDPDM